MTSIIITLCLGSQAVMDEQISRVRLENKNVTIIAIFKECEDKNVHN